MGLARLVVVPRRRPRAGRRQSGDWPHAERRRRGPTGSGQRGGRHHVWQHAVSACSSLVEQDVVGQRLPGLARRGRAGRARRGADRAPVGVEDRHLEPRAKTNVHTGQARAATTLSLRAATATVRRFWLVHAGAFVVKQVNGDVNTQTPRLSALERAIEREDLAFWTGRVPRRRLTVGRDGNKARFSRDRSAAASSHGEGGGRYEVLFASK